MAVFKFVFLWIIVFAAPISAKPQEIQHAVGKEYMVQVVSHLASDFYKGRGGGTKEEALAAAYIAREFSTIKGVKIKIQPFNFIFKDSTYHSQNVLAFLNNRQAETIIFSAHYDHIGMGGELSLNHVVNQVHNGADDNASGVALILSLAQSLSQEKTPYNYLFIAYGAHEIGLFGSAYFAQNQAKKHKKINRVINFDMVGRLSSENKVYYDCSNHLTAEFDSLKTVTLNVVKSNTDRINTLDTKWLVMQNIPSVTFSTGRHLDYHKTTDDVEHINFDGMAKIKAFLLDWLKTIPQNQPK